MTGLRARARLLPDRRRLHLQDGPIDLVLVAQGEADAVERAYRAAVARFATILDELCDELPTLRAQQRPERRTRSSPLHRATHGPPPPLHEGGSSSETASCPPPRSGGGGPPGGRWRGRDSHDRDRDLLHGRVARRMAAAVAPFAHQTFITPMAAVAGAVAEEVLDVMTTAAALDRAFVNNGGDIALHLAPGRSFRIGMVDRDDRPSLFGHVDIDAASPVRGVATSGRRGRSFSLGIADAVTILARTAADADAAATVVANAVDLPGHPAVTRLPAAALQPDSDLGSRLVTRGVGPLASLEIDRALAAGQACARDLVRRGLILGAALNLQGVTRTEGAALGRSDARPAEPVRLSA